MQVPHTNPNKYQHSVCPSSQQSPKSAANIIKNSPTVASMSVLLIQYRTVPGPGCFHGLSKCFRAGAMNISLVLLPFLLFIAFARWCWMWWQRWMWMWWRSWGWHWLSWWRRWWHKNLLALTATLKNPRCEEEGGEGTSIKPGQEAKCTKCLKAPYLAKHASFCSKCSEQVEIRFHIKSQLFNS